MVQKVLLAGYYGFHNFGDEAILETMIHILKTSYGDSLEVSVLSKKPADTEKSYSVKAYNRDNFFAILEAVLNHDIFILGGGSLLQDKTSLASLVYYYSLVKIAQLTGKKTVLLAQGIGPIETRPGMFLMKDLIKNVTLTTLRDEQSLRLLNMVGLSAHLTSDLVWLLPPLHSPQTENLSGLIHGAVGIFLRPVQGVTSHHIEQFLQIIDAALDPSIKFFIMPLQPSLDTEISNLVLTCLQKINPQRRIIYSENSFAASAVLALLAQLDFVICMRYHGILAATSCGVPSFGIAYDPKVVTLMENASLPYIDIEALQQGSYQDYFLSAWASKTIIRSNTSYFKENFVKNAQLNFEYLKMICEIKNCS